MPLLGDSVALRDRPWALVLLIVLPAVAWVFVMGNPLEHEERRLLDVALRMRPVWDKVAEDPQVLLVSIDDEDFAGLTTIDDEYAAAKKLIEDAFALGASVVGLDIIFGRGLPERRTWLADVKNEVQRLVLAEAIVPQPGGSLKRLRSFGHESLEHGQSGLINVEPDPDGVHRTYQLLRATPDGTAPSLALALYLASRGAQNIQFGLAEVNWQEVSDDGSAFLAHRWRTPRQPYFMNLRSAWLQGAGFRHQTLRGLHALRGEGEQTAKPLSGSIVIAYYLATGIADAGATSFGAHEPLVLLHATALSDLRQGSVLTRAPRWADATSVAGVLLLASIGQRMQRKTTLALWWAFSLAGHLGVCLLLVYFHHQVVGCVYAGAVWTATAVAELARRHNAEVFERLRLRSAVGMYFSPRVLKEVLESPGRLEPKRVDLIILLTDLRNSTPLAEKLGAEGMLGLLNSVFEIQNRAVFETDGSLEKPVGDQFLAYWGAPDPQPDAAERAINAASALVRDLEGFRVTLPPEIAALFGYGVAINAGTSLLGNIGSRQFFHYGVVGDLINATARVEALTKRYGVTVLITGQVLAKLRPPPAHRLLDRVIVKGKSTPLDLYELRSSASHPDFDRIAADYGKAFDCYLAGDFEAAERLFTELAPVDGPSRLLNSRVRLMKAAAPKDWNGVFRFDEK